MFHQSPLVDSIHWQDKCSDTSSEPTIAHEGNDNLVLGPGTTRVDSIHWQNKRNDTSSEPTIAHAGDGNLGLDPGTTRSVANNVYWDVGLMPRLLRG